MAILMSMIVFSCQKELKLVDPVLDIEGKMVSFISENVTNDSAFTILTYVGTGSVGGESVSDLLTAKFSTPQGIVFDSDSNMFIADRENHVIRKITPDGIVTVFAGALNIPGAQNGINGRFNRPIRLAIDGNDNLYVADRDNARIRKVTPDGIISTIAGTTTGSGMNQFYWPLDVAVTPDGQTVYVADSRNHRIQKLEINGSTWSISTLAGSTVAGYNNGIGGTAQFNTPSGLVLDHEGNIIVADRMNHCIRKVTVEGVVTLLAGMPSANSYSLDAPRLQARMGQPFGITIGENSNIYITDVEFHTVRRLSNGFLSTIAGQGVAGDTDGAFSSFNVPSDVIVDRKGNFYIADASNHKIRKLVPESRVLQYTHGWNKLPVSHEGITWYYFSGNRFFSPSINSNQIQYVNVLEIDLSVNKLDFALVGAVGKGTVSNIVDSLFPHALAALSGTYATSQKSRSGTHNASVSYLRRNNVTYWKSDIPDTNQFWVYHEGMFYIDASDNIGMEASDMFQSPFEPVLRPFMMSGAPLLISQGTVIETPSRPDWDSSYLQDNIRASTASRSVIIVPKHENKILLMCAEGKVPTVNYRSPIPRGYGMTTADLASFIKYYFNAEHALNLDGGGSASLHINGYGDNGGGSGIGVINNPALVTNGTAGTRYGNQRDYMQDAIVVLPK